MHTILHRILISGIAILSAFALSGAADDAPAGASSGLSHGELSDPHTPQLAQSDLDIPSGYHVSSASAIGLPEQSPDPMTADSDFLGEMFDTETGHGYVAVARDASDTVRASIESAPYIPVNSLATPSELTSLTSRPTTGDEVLVVISKYTDAEVTTAIDMLIDHFEKAGIVAVFGYDASLDAIRIGGDLTQTQVDEIPDIGVQYYVELGAYQDDYHNDNTRAPFVGGATIRGYKGAHLSRCTSGIPAKNSNGTRGYFTAGHCFDLTSHVWTSSSLSGASNSGRVTHHYNSKIDAQFVSGKSYSGHIYSGSVKKPVRGTWHPAASQGNRVCFQGSTAGNVCSNQVIAYNQTICTSSGCYSGLISLRGGTSSQGGDSGGPVYANFGSSVRITGIVKGHFNPLVGQSTTYVTDWREIRNNYAASLLYE